MTIKVVINEIMIQYVEYAVRIYSKHEPQWLVANGGTFLTR